MHRWAVQIFFVMMLLGLLEDSYAGREPEPWDTLPQMDNLLFSETHVGFISADQRYFVFDRTSKFLKQINERDFFQRFPDRDIKEPSQTIKEKGVGSYVLLIASNGKELKTENAYCAEGEAIHHKLWIDDEPIADYVEACHSISAVEIVNDQLWLGTRHDGEYGAYPAEGVVIQSIKNRSLIKKMRGLSGDLVRVIRIDPYSGQVWVTTEWGFDEIARDLKAIKTYYFYEDFEDITGKPVILISAHRRDSDPFAVIARWLEIKDAKNFYEAFKKIPKATRAGFSLYHFHAGTFSLANAQSIGASFVPLEMNVLVPFVIEAAKSERASVGQTALGMLCMFNDKKIFDFLLDVEEKSNPLESGDTEDLLRKIQVGMVARDCLDKFGKLGVATDNQIKKRIEVLLGREAASLAYIRSSRKDFTRLYHAREAVVEIAKSLKTIGDLRGMQLINEHFLASTEQFVDEKLYETVGQKLIYDDEIIPTVIAGLTRLMTAEVYRGCAFFDMHYKGLLGNRYNAKYAEAIIVAIENVTNFYKNKWSRKPPEYFQETCIAAFKSQIANDKVREEFVTHVYPNLPKAQKNIADTLMP